MRKITALELQRHLGRAQNLALRRPIAVTRRGRPKVVLLAFEEYERLKRRDKHAMSVWELPDDIARQIEETRMDPRHAALDRLLD